MSKTAAAVIVMLLFDAAIWYVCRDIPSPWRAPIVIALWIGHRFIPRRDKP